MQYPSIIIISVVVVTVVVLKRSITMFKLSRHPRTRYTGVSTYIFTLVLCTHDSTPGSRRPACVPITHPAEPISQKTVDSGAAIQSRGMPEKSVLRVYATTTRQTHQ
jgi:hypothetical protein